MSDNVLPFPGGDALARFRNLPEGERASAVQRHVTDVMTLAGELGSPRDWAASAIQHVRERVGDRLDGGVDVSVAALHLVLGYVAHLETQLGLAPTRGDGA